MRVTPEFISLFLFCGIKSKVAKLINRRSAPAHVFSVNWPCPAARSGWSTFDVSRNNLPFSCLSVIVAALFFCVTTGSADAAPTQEQIKQLIQKNGIPEWQIATAKIKAIHTNPPNSRAAEKWKTLDAETDVLTGKAPLERATTARDVNELHELSLWLRWRILSENADGRYSYAYAANLQHMLDRNGAPLYAKEAAVFFFHARLALSIDGARCVDQASPESVAIGYESQPYVRGLIEQIEKMSKKEKAIAMLEAVTLEELRGERPLLGALCTRGAQAMLKAMAFGRKFVEVSPNDSSASESFGKTYTIDISGIEPEVVPEEQWRKKRREVLDNYIRIAIEAL
jgi:hypothetical protein